MTKTLSGPPDRGAVAIASAPAAASAHTQARQVRLQAVADVRRSHVLEAARATFADLGLEGASLREIARRAGYTPGALYSYFASKEEVYGALLGESLERLNEQVQAATAVAQAQAAAARGAAGRSAASRDILRAAATAFFAFYRDSPRELDLGFYLFHGLRPRGLTPVLNDRLNARLRDALAPVAQALQGLGLPADAAQAEVTALFAHAVGLLLLSHTGRIRMFGQAPNALFERYLGDLVGRAHGLRDRPRGRVAPRPPPLSTP